MLTDFDSFIFTLEEFVREEIQLVEAMCEVITPLRAIARSNSAQIFSTACSRKSSRLSTRIYTVVLAGSMAKSDQVNRKPEWDA